MCHFVPTDGAATTIRNIVLNVADLL